MSTFFTATPLKQKKLKIQLVGRILQRGTLSHCSQKPFFKKTY